MTKFNITLFLCNWGPYAAYQILQDQCAPIPEEIKMIRIPCTGRISKSLLFKAFEMGADGVALVGCESGACRYGSGTDAARINTEDTREIIDLTGLSGKRLRRETFLPDESDKLLKFLHTFCDEIKAIGPSPVTPSLNVRHDPADVTLESLLSAHDVYACQDCGKCVSACSLALSGKPFSPRAIAEALIKGDLKDPAVTAGVWSCLCCGMCYERCPSAVNFPEFIRDVRQLLSSNDINGVASHGGFFHSLMRTMTSPALKTKRWGRMPDTLQIDPNSDILFFGGCAPYFDVFFKNHLNVDTTRILTDSIRLLNFFDVQPAILENERCCGHDLLWSGDLKNFSKLGELNIEAIHSRGIKEVITACPECYRTLAHDYPQHGLKIDFKVTHIYDFLETEIDKGGVSFKHLKKMLTFQDPCRMSRFEDRSDLPRNLINRLNTKGFAEMIDHGRAALCCGNCAWIGCDAYSKALQVKRLGQAHESGSDLLVTACPKCQIHLRCAMKDPFREDELQIETTDLVNIIAKTIFWD